MPTLPGFGLRVSASGSRTWIAMLRRPGDRNASRLTLGKFPTMKIKEARAAARALLSGETEAPAPRTMTVKEHALRFLAHARDRRGRRLRPQSLRLYTLALMTYAAPLHGRPVAQIRRGDIAELLHQIATERGAASAAMARGTLGRFFNWLIETDVVEANPVLRTPFYTATRGSRVLTDGEIRAIWGAGEEPNTFRSILRLCLLTGCRRAEIGNMRWSEIDEDGIWTLPAERSKTHRALELPLPATALAEITRQQRTVGKDTIFGRNSDHGFSGWSASKQRLDRQLGLKPWHVHDLRRTARTRMHAIGVTHETVIRIMNHDLGSISATYDRHTYEAEKRTGLEKWEAELLRIVAQPTAEVVSIG
jgi:integrase